MRMRVVHITGCLDLGGQEKLLLEFARHADRDCFDLHFVSLGTRGILASELEAQGWPVTALDQGAGLLPRLPLLLAKLLRSCRAEIVHTHNERPLLYGAAAVCLARGPRLIHTKHGRGTYNSRRQVFLASLAARRTDRFLCVSDDCARLALNQGVPASRVTTLHNGIDTTRFGYSGPREGGPAVLVARLCADKDVATLLHAVQLVVRQDPSFRLLIAGDGPLRDDLTRLTDRLGLTGQVRFLGMVHDVPALMKQASVYVLSSISEGVSLTILEAMACGLPIVATNVGGTPEAVVNGVSGLLTPPGQPDALASALLRVRRDPTLARKMGEAGRLRVQQHFDVRRMVEQYERLYRGEPASQIALSTSDLSRANDLSISGLLSRT